MASTSAQRSTIEGERFEQTTGTRSQAGDPFQTPVRRTHHVNPAPSKRRLWVRPTDDDSDIEDLPTTSLRKEREQMDAGAKDDDKNAVSEAKLIRIIHQVKLTSILAQKSQEPYSNISAT